MPARPVGADLHRTRGGETPTRGSTRGGADARSGSTRIAYAYVVAIRLGMAACAAAMFAAAAAAQQFSADLVSAGTEGMAVGTPGRIHVSNGKVRLETPEVRSGFFVIDGSANTAYFVKPAQRIFMDARQSSVLAQIFVPVDPGGPLRAMASHGEAFRRGRQWRGMALRADRRGHDRRTRDHDIPRRFAAAAQLSGLDRSDAEDSAADRDQLRIDVQPQGHRRKRHSRRLFSRCPPTFRNSIRKASSTASSRATCGSSRCSRGRVDQAKPSGNRLTWLVETTRPCAGTLVHDARVTAAPAFAKATAGSLRGAKTGLPTEAA